MPAVALMIAGALPAAGGSPATDAAAGLAARVLGSAAAGFRFEQIGPDDGRDVFELESRDRTVVVRGNSALSMASGLNWYLKYHAHASVSLNGCQTRLPDPLPAVPAKVRQPAWASARYFFNYCTFGYSVPWWDWSQWEFLIDWMALHGINQPLAVTGQEAVWQAVGRRFGMSEAELDAFFAGPPYLPFQWMGCLDGHGGPLPGDWIPRRAELQRKILVRERELGMTPVLQGFTGHVPEALLKKFPAAKAQRIRWVEFNTWMLDPLDPLFQQLGTAFLEEQTRLFGTDHLYAADSFIEMTPPSGDLTYLARLGRAIHAGMAASDPRAVWLLQGWAFFHGRQFWTPDRVKAFLDAVPPDGMQVLDLFCENHPVWNRTEGFHGKPWVWSFVYNFGNNTMIGGSGPLDRFADLAAARRDPLGRNLRGVGLMMEGFGHNPLLYELMFERAWRDQVDLPAWTREFVRFRYGQAHPAATAAWETLRTAPYAGSRNTASRTAVTSFPAAECNYGRHPSAALAAAWRQLLDAAPELGGLETYRHDLVNVGRQCLSNQAGPLHEVAMAACRAGDAAGFRQASGAMIELIRDLDELLATSDQFLLGRWLEDAKRWGTTEQERARLEWNARRVLTLWGTGTALRDYAWKEWSGMLTGFYAKRWEIFFRHQQEALDAGRPLDAAACQREILEFENEWAAARETYPTEPRGNCIEVARRLFEKHAPRPVAHLASGKPATCSLALPGMDAALANDGLVDTGSYWGTDVTKDPAAWWQVDLGSPTPVGRVVVVGYFGDRRCYGFTVEGSVDGATWEVLADRRENQEPATAAGHTCAFEPRPIRHLRVTLTANSANTGRHLVEVMAFAN